MATPRGGRLREKAPKKPEIGEGSLTRYSTRTAEKDDSQLKKPVLLTATLTRVANLLVGGIHPLARSSLVSLIRGYLWADKN